jgi:KDO2-lipid IV(A) lauroyltransferase
MMQAKRLRYALEAFAALLIYALFRALPVDAASGLGGALLRLIGPRLPAHGRARRNLSRALPDLSPAEIECTLHAMWWNLGRVLGEYAHLDHFRPYEAGGRVEVIGAELLDAERTTGKGGIFFSGHVGNWEIAALAIERRGIPVALVYRAPNNPLVDWLIWRARGPVAALRVPKGRAGVRGLLQQVQTGGHLAMLVDQKMNDGIPVPFFGRDAMTAPGLAELALRFGVPAYPVRVERLKGAHFRITIYPAISPAQAEERQASVRETMAEVNQILEGWIRERPEQWLWPHRRWPD